jgi:hypothetical protein
MVDQPAHRVGTLLGDEARGVLVDKTRAGVLGVIDVQIDAVVAAQHAHDAALRPGGGGLAERTFGQHHHPVIVGQIECHRQAGQPRADDDHGSGRQSLLRRSHGARRQRAWRRLEGHFSSADSIDHPPAP